MKICKIFLSFFLAGALFFACTLTSDAAGEDKTMTYGEFSNLLVKVLGIEMPADTEGLAADEIFEIQANMLAARGIIFFVGAAPEDLVTRGLIAEIIYAALVSASTTGTDYLDKYLPASDRPSTLSPINPAAATMEEKIKYLVGLDYMGPGNADEILYSDEIINILNIPGLSAAVAEGYSSSRGPRGGPPLPPPQKQTPVGEFQKGTLLLSQAPQGSYSGQEGPGTYPGGEGGPR